MSILAQDSSGDLLLSATKQLTIVKDTSQCAAQKLTNRFLLVLGEWFLDTTLGIPYFQVVWVKAPDLRVVQALFTKVVLSVSSILSIDFLNLNLATGTRKLSMNLQARTDTGATIVGGEGAAFRVA